MNLQKGYSVGCIEILDNAGFFADHVSGISGKLSRYYYKHIQFFLRKKIFCKVKSCAEEGAFLHRHCIGVIMVNEELRFFLFFFLMFSYYETSRKSI